MVNQQQLSSLKKDALKIAAIYAVCGVLWLLFADKLILDLLPARNAGEWVVISNDRRLRERARQRGAAVRTLDEWKRRRPRPVRRTGQEPRLSSREITEWENYFSAGREDDHS